MASIPTHCPKCQGTDIRFREKRNDWCCDDCDHHWQIAVFAERQFTYDPDSEMRPSVFISCASDEFADHRGFLRAKLLRKGVSPITQEDMLQSGGKLLKKLDDEIRKCVMVVHLVGDSIGFDETPPAAAIEQVLADLKVWAGKTRRLLPEPLDHFHQFEKLTFTQWEAVLANLYGKKLFVYLSTTANIEVSANIERADENDSRPVTQQQHLSWLVKVGHEIGSNRFADPMSLWEIVSDDITSSVDDAMRHHRQRVREAAVAKFLLDFSPLSPRDETNRELAGDNLLGSRFYGRDWLHNDIANWLKGRGGEPVCWLQADAGFGKSRFCSELALGWKDSNKVLVDAVVYLNPTLSAVAVLSKICAQLRHSCPIYRQDFESAWQAVDWHCLDMPAELNQSGEEQEKFVELLIEPLLLGPLRQQLANSPQTSNALIVIDGLDELMQWRDGQEIHPLRVLLTKLLAARLPNFRVLFTSRPTHSYPLLRNLFDAKNARKPKLDLEQMQGDAAKFIEGELKTWSAPDVVKRLLHKSKSSMLYLHYLVNEVAVRQLAPDDVDSLPHGMANYYLDKLDQYFSGTDFTTVFEATVQPCLEVIAAGERTHLTVTDIENCCGKVNVDRLRHSLRSMIKESQSTADLVLESENRTSAFIVERPRTVNGQAGHVFVPFHLSFTDWLLGRQFDEGDDGAEDDALERESRKNHKFRVSVEEGDRRLAQWTARQYNTAKESKVTPNPNEYWVRQGVEHVLRTFSHFYNCPPALKSHQPLEQFTYLVQAVDILGWLKQFNNVPVAKSAVSRALSMLSAALSQSTKSESTLTSDDLKAMEPVDQFALFELVKDICSTDITDNVIWWIGRTQLNEQEWQELVIKMLDEEWVVRFAAASGQAARYRRLGTDPSLTDHHRQLAVREIDDLLNSEDVNRQEMGCYAVGEIANFPDQLVKGVKPHVAAWLQRVSMIDLYFAQSVLGDILINLTLRGAHDRVAELDELILNGTGLIDAFWTPIWHYTRQDVIRVLAHRAVDSQTLKRNVSEFPGEVGLAAEALGARTQRIEDFANHAGPMGPDLMKILQKPELDIEGEDGNEATDTETILDWLTRENVPIDQRVSTAAELLQLLFTHTTWRVSEKGSAVLAALHARTHDDDTCLRILDHLINSLATLPPESWRVIYGTAEACYLSRNFDTGCQFLDGKSTSRLDHCIRTYFKHSNCDIRGLLVENLAFLVEQPEQGQIVGNKGRKIEYPKHYTDEINRWLHDDDIWVLEHVYQMFLAIKANQVHDLTLDRWIQERLEHVESNPACLLAKVNHVAGKPWIEMDRRDFLRELQHLRRRQPAETVFREEYTG